MARQLNGYARCEGCGTSYAACPDVYECAECEEDEEHPLSCTCELYSLYASSST